MGEITYHPTLTKNAAGLNGKQEARRKGEEEVKRNWCNKNANWGGEKCA